MKRMLVSLMAVFLTLCSIGLVQASSLTPGVIMGSGIGNTGFTVVQNNGVELGLAAKTRFPTPLNAVDANNDGVYEFSTGGPSSGKTWWSIDWSINTDWNNNTGLNLSDLTYAFGRDIDASQATNFVTSDPIHIDFADHSFGDNTDTDATDKIADDASEYAAFITDYNVAQNSAQAGWIFPGIDPALDGTYNVFLSAFRGNTELARTEIQVVVGNGGAPVPEPTTVLLFGLGLLSLAGVSRRKQ